MNEMITTCLNEKNVAPLIDFPKFLMSEFETEICSWIFEYVHKHKESPSTHRLQTQFPFFLPIVDDPPLPISDVVEMTLTKKRVEFTQRRLSEISAAIDETRNIDIDQLNGLMQALSQSSGDLSRYSTFDRSLYFRKSRLKIGFPLIDRAIGGIANGDYMLIAGRLGTGKSTLAQWIAERWWSDGRRVLYISKEMLAADVFSRIDGIVGTFNPLRLRMSDPEDIGPTLGIVSSIARAGGGEIFIPSREVSTPQQVATLASHLGVDAIIIDGIYLMQTEKSSGSRWERVADVSNQIKQIGLNLQIPIIGLTQIKRVGDKDEYTPEDLAYTDALGQDADFILTIHPNAAIKNRVELQLVKNRFGTTAATIIYFDFDTMRVIDESISGRFEMVAESDDDDDED